MESREKAIILVVDDQLDIRILSKRILEREGFVVILAEDGSNAIELLHAQKVDLVITDIAMPNLNGYQLFERVNQNPEWVNIPFIFLSARDLDSDIRYGKSLGVDDYITKPFEPADLVASVKGRLLRAAQLASCLNISVENAATAPESSDRKPGVQSHPSALFIDTRRQLVNFSGKEIKFSAREFRLLFALYENRHRVVPVEELLGITHNLTAPKKLSSDLLRPLVRSIRRKLGFPVGENGCIRNVRGIGYQYIDYGAHPAKPSNDAPI
jgi:two-component system OmpR family response regulator